MWRSSATWASHRLNACWITSRRWWAARRRCCAWCIRAGCGMRWRWVTFKLGADLHDLPAEHPDRNRPLAGCWYRWTKGKAWREVKQTFGITQSSYNDLGPAWIERSVFFWGPKGQIRGTGG